LAGIDPKAIKIPEDSSLSLFDCDSKSLVTLARGETIPSGKYDAMIEHIFVGSKS